MPTIFPFLKTPSVSFSFLEPNTDGTYTLNVKFENVNGAYRFFVTDPHDETKMHELFNNNKFPTGGHVMVASGPHTFYLLYGPGLAKIETRLEDKDYAKVEAFNALLEECRNPENGCKVVQENVAVDPNKHRIITNKNDDGTYSGAFNMLGGRKSRKSRKHCNRKSRNRKQCNRKSRKSRNRKSRRR